MKKLFLFAIATLFFTSCIDKVEITDDTCSQRCDQPADPGICQAAFTRYYFDPVDKKCKPFTWGGCGTFPFQTLQECENCGCQ